MRFLDFKYDYPQAARDANFKLKQHKNGPIDWRLIGSLEVCRIVDEQNFEQIDGTLEHLAEVPLGCLLDTNILESGIAKYFMLAQYSIQYLLFCRGFLEETIGDLKEANDTAQKEMASLKQNLHDSNQQVLQLHRKVTEIECLHEVIYPCHLCTKNFISNEALNLHLCRKHPSNMSRRATSFTSDLSLMSVDGCYNNGQDSDQALINTIKLELELKHLKKRLALTEQVIKERNLSDSQISKLISGQEIRRTFHHIAIQSNLADDKDIDEGKQNEDESSQSKQIENEGEGQGEGQDEGQDEGQGAGEVIKDSSVVELANVAPSLPEDNMLIQQMEHQLNNFEEWKKDQQKQNEYFMLTIQEKLQHLTLAMEQQMKGNKQNDEEQRMQTSIAPDLEQLLYTKMEEMTTTNVNRLEDIIHKLNMDYNHRLEGLQKDLTNYFEISVQKNSMENVVQETKVQSSIINEEKDNVGIVNSNDIVKDINQQRNRVVQVTAPTTTKMSISKPNPVGKVQVKQVKAVMPKDLKMDKKSKGSISAEEDVDVNVDVNVDVDEEELDEEEASDDGTIVSEMSSLQDVQQLQESGDVSKNQKMSRTFVVDTKDTAKVTHLSKKNKKKDSRPALENRRAKSQRPEITAILTRSDIRNMANVRLKPFGLDMKTKSITGLIMKRALGRIQDSRNLMQNNDPQFTSTRNKLKKFVDKLCSNKLPTNAKILLQETKMKRQRILMEDVNDIASSSSNQSIMERQPTSFVVNDNNRVEKFSDDRQGLVTSTPETEREDFLNDDLKARLERILASPVRQPDSYQLHTVKKMTKAMVHHHHHHGQGDAGMDRQQDHEDEIMIKPVPLPRKRVMFEQPLTVNRNVTTIAASRKSLYNRDQMDTYLGNQSL